MNNSYFIRFLLAFIPLFVAVDALGNIPLFISLVEHTGRKARRAIIGQSVATATVVALSFILLGKTVLTFLNITIGDFQIAGGLLLFIIAVRLLLPGAHKTMPFNDKDVGVFPLGTPLVTGPAVLTTSLLLLEKYGLIITMVSIIANMAIVWLFFARAETVIKIIGVNGTRAFAKIMYILLAAIGVMMVRHGIMEIIK